MAKATHVEINGQECRIVDCECGKRIFFYAGIPWMARLVPMLLKEGDDEEFHKGSAYLNHFANCPLASKFSKKGAKP